MFPWRTWCGQSAEHFGTGHRLVGLIILCLHVVHLDSVQCIGIIQFDESLWLTNRFAGIFRFNHS